MVDALSVSLRALSFVALFQAAGISLFLVFFGRLVVASESTLRRAATLSALVAMGVLVAEYVLEAARMSGDFSGLMDLTLQSQVMHSSTAAALAGRLLGLVLIILALRLRGPVVVPLSVAGILLLTSAFALTGHTATHPERSARERLRGSANNLWAPPARETGCFCGAHGPRSTEQMAVRACGQPGRSAGDSGVPPLLEERIHPDRRSAERDGDIDQLLFAGLSCIRADSCIANARS